MPVIYKLVYNPDSISKKFTTQKRPLWSASNIWVSLGTFQRWARAAVETAYSPRTTMGSLCPPSPPTHTKSVAHTSSSQLLRVAFVRSPCCVLARWLPEVPTYKGKISPKIDHLEITTIGHNTILIFFDTLVLESIEDRNKSIEERNENIGVPTLDGCRSWTLWTEAYLVTRSILIQGADYVQHRDIGR